jgi:hypothetical protein
LARSDLRDERGAKHHRRCADQPAPTRGNPNTSHDGPQRSAPQRAAVARLLRFVFCSLGKQKETSLDDFFATTTDHRRDHIGHNGPSLAVPRRAL